MKQVVVGVYKIGSDQCQLVLREGTGGDFYSCPEKGSIPRIKVGADERQWDVVVGVLLHEAFEFVANRLQCRYDLTDDLGRDHASYLFVMRHPQFSDCCMKVAEFTSAALRDLAKAWRQWGKPPKKRIRKRGRVR